MTILCSKDEIICKCSLTRTTYFDENHLHQSYFGACIHLDAYLPPKSHAGDQEGDEAMMMALPVGRGPGSSTGTPSDSRYATTHIAPDENPTWLYGYCKGRTQPLRLWRAGYGGEDLERYVASQAATEDPTAMERDYSVYRVFPQPADLQYRKAKGFVVARTRDLGGHLLPVLVDISWREVSSGSTTSPYGPAIWRQTKLVDFHLNRRTLLEQSGLEALCNRERHPCDVSLRGIAWPESDSGLRRVVEGDHVEVSLAIPHPRIPLFVQWQLLEDGCSLPDIPNRAASEARQRNPDMERDSSSNQTIRYEDDATNLMQRPSGEHWFHIFPLGTDEPYAFALRGHELQFTTQALHRKLAEKDQTWSASPGSLYEVCPQPASLVSFGVTAFLRKDPHDMRRGISIAMFDVEIYQELSIDRQVRDQREWREVSLVQERTSKGRLLEELQLTSFCDGRGSKCQIIHGDEVWEHDQEERLIFDGDYLVIRIRPGENHDILCTSTTPPPLDTFDVQDRNPIPELLLEETTEEAEFMDDMVLLQTNLHTTTSRDGNQQQNQGGETAGHPQRWGDTPEEWDMSQVNFSFAFHAWQRLPPPGNGKTSKTVGFNDSVCYQHANGKTETKRDHAISNIFVEDTIKNLREDQDNPFLQGYLHGLRYGPQCGLPLKSLENADEEKLDDEPLLPIYVAEEPPRMPISLELTIGSTFLPCSDQPQTTTAGIDFRQVLSFKRWFQDFLPLPVFDRTLIPWKKASQRIHELPVWTSEPGDLHFFLDGSVGSTHIGAGVLLLVKSSDVWYFGGFMHYHQDRQQQVPLCSYHAELLSQLIAGKWCFDAAKLMMRNHRHKPSVKFHFDCFAAGKGTSGESGGQVACPYFCAARNVFYTVTKGLNIDIVMSHAKAHAGIFGNECADDIAKWTTTLPSVMGSPWEMFFNGNSLILSWLWWTFCEDFHHLNHDGFVQIPKPHFMYDEQIIKTIQKKDTVKHYDFTDELDLRIVSYNTQTLNSGLKRKNESLHGSPGKLDELLHTLIKHDIQVFGLQETRVKRFLPPRQDYLIFQSLADKKGRGGIMTGIGKNLRFFRGHNQRDGPEDQISEGDVKVFHSEPEILILRVDGNGIQLVIANAHSPHTGHSDAQIQHWWTRFGRLVHDAGPDIPKLVLLDANAKLGSEDTQTTGGHQPEEAHFASKCLLSFLQDTRTWIPATFQDCQKGPGHTWTHPGGTQSRIDYICVPQTWQSYQITTRVAAEWAINEHIFDHKPLYAEVCGPFERTGTSKRRARRRNPHRFDMRNPA